MENTFKENPGLLAWKKIEYKNGIVKAAFRNVNGQDIECKGGEMPHPDFRQKLGLLSRFAKAIFQVDGMVEATSIEYPEAGKLKITATLTTPFAQSEVKTKPIDYADIEAWDANVLSATNTETGEVITLLDLIKDIDDETHDYLFKGKNAQQKIDFPEETYNR